MKCDDGKLLRNTIIFSNYLSRKYLSENEIIKFRYEPLKSFRELKKYIDNINVENNQLKAFIINIKQKLSDLEYKRKNLEKLLIKNEIEYKEILIKVEKAKKIKLALFKLRNNNKNISTKKESRLINSKNNTNLLIDINNKRNIFNTLDIYSKLKR